MKTDLFQCCGHCCIFEICWHIECNTFTASSFRIWNSSTGIPSPPLALFVVMLSKAHLASHSMMSGSRWVITPSWLSGSWRSFLYSSFVYSNSYYYQPSFKALHGGHGQHGIHSIRSRGNQFCVPDLLDNWTSQVPVVVKNPPGNARDLGSIPGSGRSSGEGNSSPLQNSCLENPMDRRAWWATAHGVWKSQTWLSMQSNHNRKQAF